MIQKDSTEWNLWKDVFEFRNRFTPPPRYSESGEYWKDIMHNAHIIQDKYNDTDLELLSIQLFLGVILQLEYESKKIEETEKPQDLIKELAEKLNIYKVCK